MTRQLAKEASHLPRHVLAPPSAVRGQPIRGGAQLQLRAVV